MKCKNCGNEIKLFKIEKNNEITKTKVNKEYPQCEKCKEVYNS